MAKSDRQLDTAVGEIKKCIEQLTIDYPSNDSPDAWVREYAFRRLSDEAKRFAATENRELVTDYDDTSILSHAVKEMEPSDFLIGLSHWYYDCLWWTSTDAEIFLKANTAAIGHAIRFNKNAVRIGDSESRALITRIFVHEFSDLSSPIKPGDKFRKAFIKTMNDNQRMGVDVRVIAVKKMSNKERLRLRSRCVIKGKLAYEIELDKADRFPTRNRFFLPGNDDNLDSSWKKILDLERESVPLSKVSLPSL